MWITSCVVSVGVGVFALGADVPTPGVMKERPLRDLREYLGPVPTYLASGMFDERRRVPMDDSYTVDEMEFGAMRIKGLARVPAQTARFLINLTLPKELQPPKDAAFRAYRRQYRKGGDADDRLSDYDGYDTVVVDYSCGGDRIQIAQTCWVLAMTIEGPDTRCDVDGSTDGLTQQARNLIGRWLILREEPVFETPKRFAACVAAKRVEIGRRSQSRAEREGASGDSTSSSSEVMRAYCIGWWCDGVRFGFLCWRLGDPRSGVGSAVDPAFNRNWFDRPRNLDTARRMAAEYRASTAPGKTQE